MCRSNTNQLNSRPTDQPTNRSPPTLYKNPADGPAQRRARARPGPLPLPGLPRLGRGRAGRARVHRVFHQDQECGRQPRRALVRAMRRRFGRAQLDARAQVEARARALRGAWPARAGNKTPPSPPLLCIRGRRRGGRPSFASHQPHRPTHLVPSPSAPRGTSPDSSRATHTLTEREFSIGQSKSSA